MLDQFSDYGTTKPSLYSSLFPFGLQVSNLVLLKIRALEIVVEVEPCENF